MTQLTEERDWSHLDPEDVAFLQEEAKYAAPPNHPILGASLLTSSEVQKLREINTLKSLAGKK